MTEPITVVKRPIEVEAIRFAEDGANWMECLQFVDDSKCEIIAGSDGPGSEHARIYTLEGVMRCEPGDWIIRGVKGEFYPCKPDIFEQTYEEAANA